jgi:phosphopantetheinyl transferase
MCSHGSVGIDVAYPEEFAGPYPLGRAFGRDELDCAWDLAQQDIGRAAALLWSLKEATVKATGTGFNRHDPFEVRVSNPREGHQGIVFDVWAGGFVTAWARAEGKGWLAVASCQRTSDHFSFS